MAVIRKTGKFEGDIELPIEYPFRLDDFQLHSAQGIAEGKNLLIVAHTGCGKTICAELAIAYCLNVKRKLFMHHQSKHYQIKRCHHLVKNFQVLELSRVIFK